jgi:hypothetical protein
VELPTLRAAALQEAASHQNKCPDRILLWVMEQQAVQAAHPREDPDTEARPPAVCQGIGGEWGGLIVSGWSADRWQLPANGTLDDDDGDDDDDDNDDMSLRSFF